MKNNFSYELKKGLMYKNGKPVIGLGVSYYASYHPLKVPIPEDGDRIGLMDKDLEDMKAAGFNVVRFAALGNIKKEDHKVDVDFPFIDAMLNKGEEIDLACMVRLQGYNMVLGDYSDYTMLNERNEEMPFHWGWFVRNCLNHPQVIEDNKAGTIASSIHFSEYSAVIGYQIYNEPAYPWKDFYDYNPYTIKAYREWLRANRNIEDVDSYDPPRKRMEAGEDTQEWIDWRMFNTNRLSAFLCEVGEFSKLGDPKHEVFTCMMTNPLYKNNSLRGEDYYKVAEGMDFLGLTHYIPFKEKEFFRAMAALDAVESAAALFGKTGWIIEHDGSTGLTAAEWERETYAALGCGIKGIVYYQWRADYPFPESPEPQGFGIVWADGTPTEKYNGVIKMNKLINDLSTTIAQADKVRSSVGILYSHNTMAHLDAFEKGDILIENLVDIYKELRERQIVVDFVRAEDLADNDLGVKLLFVPTIEGLSSCEKTALKEYTRMGFTVAVYESKASDGNSISYRLQDESDVHTTNKELILIDELIKKEDIESPVKLIGDCNGVDVRLLESEENTVVVISVSGSAEIKSPLEIRLKCKVLESVTFYDTIGQEQLEWSNLEGEFSIKLPRITTGAFVIINK